MLTDPERRALEESRLDQDLSYSILARQVGVSEGTIYRLLNAPTRNSPSKRTVHKVRKYITLYEQTLTQQRRRRDVG